MPSLQQVLERLARQETERGMGRKMPGADVPGSGMSENTIHRPDTSAAELPGAGPYGSDAYEPGSSGSDKTTGIVAGLCILLLILLVCTMYTVTSMTPGSGPAGLQNGSPDEHLTNPDENLAASTATPTPVPPVTPVIISSTPVPQDIQPAAPKMYVTLEPVPVIVPTLQDLTADFPTPDYSNLFTIFSMSGQRAQDDLPYVVFSLKNPPLVIDYTVTPINTTIVKEWDYKILKTYYHERNVRNREFDYVRFNVKIRDRDTGEVVLEDGYGGNNSLLRTRHLVLYKGGDYRFEFTGRDVYVDLAMKVKKEGNIE